MTRILSIAALALCLHAWLHGHARAGQVQGHGQGSHGHGPDRHRAHQESRTREGLADFDNPKGGFVDRDLYIVVYDLKGKVLAHGANPKLIGKDLIDLRDVDGKYFVRERVEMMSKSPDAKGWQDYKFMNPDLEPDRAQAMYLQRFEDVIVGCGIYKA